MNRVTARAILHGSSAALAALWLLSPEALRYGLLTALGGALLVESLRWRSPAFRGRLNELIPLFRPEESNRPSGAFWLAMGYSLASWFPSSIPVEAVLVAALADPAASLVGRRWSTGGRKSWPGTLSFGLVALSLLLVLGRSPLTAIAVAGAGAVLERWPGPLNDNLLVPLGTAFTLMILA